MKKKEIKSEDVEAKSERQPYRVRLPGFIGDKDIGLGDVIKRATTVSFRNLGTLTYLVPLVAKLRFSGTLSAWSARRVRTPHAKHMCVIRTGAIAKKQCGSTRNC